MKKILISLILCMFIINLASASLGTFKQAECVSIRVLANCSAVNLTEITTNKDIFVINSPMTKLGGQTFNYTFCNTSEIGTYTYSWDNLCVDCSDGTCGNSFEVTISGQPNASSGQGLVLFGSLIVIIFAAIILFLISLGFESSVAKVVMVGLSIISLVVAILFSMVMITQNLGGYSDIISGYETFWFVTKIILALGILALLIFSMFMVYKLWMIKKGFRDA